MPRILLSYRRADSQAISGRLFDRLAHHFGKDKVFIDIDNIPFGVDFRDHINDALASCDLMLAIIGPAWAGGKGKNGIWTENDWVRIEVEAALQRKIPVVPVLVGGRKMPSQDELPPSLADLAYRNAMELDQGRDFHTHADRLIASIDAQFAPGRAASVPARPPRAAGSRLAGLRAILSSIPRPWALVSRGLGALSLERPPRFAAVSAAMIALALVVSGTFFYLAEREVDAAAGRLASAMSGDYAIERKPAPLTDPQDN